MGKASFFYFFKLTFFLLPAKHGWHIGIMTLSCELSSASSRWHTFGFLSITFEGVHQFKNLQKGKAWFYKVKLKKEVIHKIWLRMALFWLRFWLNILPLDPHSLLVRYQPRVNHDICINFPVFWAAADIPSPCQKWFSIMHKVCGLKVTQEM